MIKIDKLLNSINEILMLFDSEKNIVTQKITKRIKQPFKELELKYSNCTINEHILNTFKEIKNFLALLESTDLWNVKNIKLRNKFYKKIHVICLESIA